jgi:hypothetical protein
MTQPNHAEAKPVKATTQPDSAYWNDMNTVTTGPSPGSPGARRISNSNPNSSSTRGYSTSPAAGGGSGNGKTGGYSEGQNKTKSEGQSEYLNHHPSSFPGASLAGCSGSSGSSGGDTGTSYSSRSASSSAFPGTSSVSDASDASSASRSGPDSQHKHSLTPAGRPEPSRGPSGRTGGKKEGEGSMTRAENGEDTPRQAPTGPGGAPSTLEPPRGAFDVKMAGDRAGMKEEMGFGGYWGVAGVERMAEKLAPKAGKSPLAGLVETVRIETAEGVRLEGHKR